MQHHRHWGMTAGTESAVQAYMRWLQSVEKMNASTSVQLWMGGFTAHIVNCVSLLLNWKSMQKAQFMVKLLYGSSTQC